MLMTYKASYLPAGSHLLCPKPGIKDKKPTQEWAMVTGKLNPKMRKTAVGGSLTADLLQKLPHDATAGQHWGRLASRVATAAPELCDLQELTSASVAS